MSRPALLPTCVAFCSILFLALATGCQAFPKVKRRETTRAYAEKEQSEKINTDDQESISFAPKYMSQHMSSEAPMVLSTEFTVTPLNKVFSVNKESHLPGTGLLYPTSPGVYSSSEPVVSASEQEHGPSQLGKMSPEQGLSKVMLTVAVSSPASLNPDQEGPYSSSSTQPIVEVVTNGTRGFLGYADNQLLATESHETVSLGNSPSSSINMKEPEKIKADAVMRSTVFPHVDSTRDTGSDREKPSKMAANDAQSTTTEYLVTVSKNVLTMEPRAGSVLGDLQVTVSVSTPAPVSSVFSEEWDDTKFESISRGMLPEPVDNAETRVITEPPHGTPDNFEGTEESPTSTEVTKMTPELQGGETAFGTALASALGDERSPVLTHQIPFTPMSLAEDPEVSTMKLFSSAGSFTASTHGDSSPFSETAVSTSHHESVPQQTAENVLKDITQEMTMVTQETDSTLSEVTQGYRATIEAPRGSGEPEEGMPSPSPASAELEDAELSRRWESLATPASTTVVPWSLTLTSSIEDLMDTITGPSEEFIPVLGSPVAPPAMTVEAPTISPALPSQGRTSPPISHLNTAASYGLEQLESEEVEDDEDEEDEEDEEEEEDEEDEDDEGDKEEDSLYKDFNGDTEPPGFTLPGITSQEPDIGTGSMDLLEGATYQVPETIEWEQQNQGLVRSWMEKLKDKAGYMSGMLVPVGVGIAGALFILGALYSIKVMNRRRRNGFKRHKRKQREFNSMQDRVMLLADSSEDEF